LERSGASTEGRGKEAGAIISRKKENGGEEREMIGLSASIHGKTSHLSDSRKERKKYGAGERKKGRESSHSKRVRKQEFILRLRKSDFFQKGKKGLRLAVFKRKKVQLWIYPNGSPKN